ncbi:MAG TPA: hypothetical protein VEB63_10615 [Chitinophagaceae bacterium]|nr:hypothetical protein [Chitinophagaceae bacterium]
MKTILLALGLLAGVGSFAQDSTRLEQYCTMVATPRLLSTRVTVDIDYGEERSIWKDHRVKDEEGRLKKFNTVVDGLNYLGKMGWKLVNAFPVVTSGGVQIYHYVFRKEFRRSEVD